MIESHKYTAILLPKEYKAVSKYHLKREAKAWILSSLKTGFSFAFAGLILTPIIVWPNPILIENMVKGVLFAFLLGSLTPFLAIYDAIEKFAPKIGDYPFECEISETHWSYMSRELINTSLPFSKIKIIDTHPLAFFITCGDTDLEIYRRPLQEAGLEQLFLDQLKKQQNYQAAQ